MGTVTWVSLSLASLVIAFLMIYSDATTSILAMEYVLVSEIGIAFLDEQ